MPSDAIGHRIGPWELRRLLGQGGMGAVYQAFEPETGIWSAVKVLAPGRHITRDQASESLLRELDAVRRLSHPHVVRLIGFGLVDDSVWLAMELVTDAHKPEPGTWPQARAVLAAVLRALAHAHAHRVLHLDVKPDNILVEDDPDGGEPRVLLGDFGMAAMSAGDGLVRVRGGTLPYMAPEQLRMDPRRVGPATDQYAVGCLATTLVTGGPPFQGSLERVRAAHLHRSPPLLQPRFDVPSALQSWVDRLLQKAPENRFPTAAHALAALLELGPVEQGSGFGGARSETTSTTFSFDLLDRMAAETEPTTTSVSHIPPLTCPERPPILAATAVPNGLLLVEEGPPPLPDDPAVQAMWSILHEMGGEGPARVAWLQGPVGVGALAAARFVARLAYEHGLTDHLELYPDPVRTLRRWHRCGGLAGGALHRWLAGLPLAQDVLSRDNPASAGPEALRAALVEAIRHRARKLPVVLVVAVDSPDRQLIEQVGALTEPVLALVRVPEGTQPEGHVVPVEPSPGDMERRLRPWVQLQARVALELEDRAGGCARLAVALLAEWRQQGALLGEQILQPSPTHGLMPPVLLPEVARLLDTLSLSTADQDALIEAALAGDPPPQGRQALCRPDGTWSPACREGLRALAEPRHHRAVAARSPLEAQGLHLLAAGAPDEAAPILLEAARRFGETVNDGLTEQLIAAWRAATAGREVSPEARAQVNLLQAEVLARRGQRFEEIVALTQAAAREDPAQSSWAHAMQAHALACLQRTEEAHAAVDEALTPDANVDTRRVALRVRFILQRRSEQLDEAAETLARMGELVQDPYPRAEWIYSSALLAADRGQVSEAIALFDQAAPLFQEQEMPRLAAIAYVSAASQLRTLGLLDEAERRLNQARDAGLPDPFQDLRYAQIDLARGDLEPMRAVRDRLRALPDLGQVRLRMLKLMEIPLAAAEADPARWQEAMAFARECLEHRYERGELPWALEQAARVAMEHGEPGRAAEAAELGARAWRGIRREGDARRLEALYGGAS